ncbi:ribosome biogenesis factor YjgA [Oleiagrimonas sp. C23AA]|uniref:ribosome biogenesis factor YjgA n=1 Tax=Oleiagrimonas sp. C23AA TaxID=2719047 RepID=UPI0014237DBA|nr:ribosome biogenesis factor YjgA [Oleiagrimonas sp. C23AA]NII10098.1 DUF615 domain-containing protein [Oleiagrimonas sp. C23AA]
MQPHDEHDIDANEDDYGPSRSQQRRDALAMLELAEQLVAMTPSQLAKLDLPDDVLTEIAQTKRIKAHIARKRQMAFLAKIMRRHGEEAFTHVRAALGEDRDRQRQENAAMQRLEVLRERLLGEDGNAALSELIEAHPQIDRQHLRSLIRQARTEREKNKPPHAYRELFRSLREIERGE